MSTQGTDTRHPAYARWDRWDFGAHQRRSAVWLAHFVDDPEMQRVRTCIELVIGNDKVLRVSTDELSTTSSIDSKVYRWDPALLTEPEITDSYSVGEVQAAARTMTITLPGELIDCAGLIAAGRMLAGFAEVSLLVDGMDYDARLVLMRGCTRFGFGASGQVVTVQITDARDAIAAELPAITADSTRLTLIHDSAVGQRYPIVLNDYPYVPCVRAIDSWGVSGQVFMATQGPDVWDVDAVYLDGALQAGGRYTSAAYYDAFGQPYLGIDYTFADLGDDVTFYAGISRTDGVYEDVIGCVDTLLRESTAFGISGINAELVGIARARMPRIVPSILLGASGEGATSAIAVVESILESFPMVSLVFEGGGIGPVVTDRRIGPAQLGLELTGGTSPSFPLIQRVSGPDETPPSELFTRFELRYGYNALLDQYESVGVRDSRNTPALAKLERSAVVVRPMSPIDSPYIFDAGHANYVLDWLVAHLATPSYLVEWDCFAWAYWMFRRGMTVRYTDAELGFSDAVATVETVGYTRGRCRLGLRIWHPNWDGLGGVT